MTKATGNLFPREEQDLFFRRAAEKLCAHPSDYLSQYATIAASATGPAPHLAAGVLLPIRRRSPEAGEGAEGGELVFQLIKRSSRVSQAGDLSCPGGILRPRLDRLLALMLRYGPLSSSRGPGKRCSHQGGEALSRLLFLFMANALRETWEEIRLSPLHVHLLGPLPTYSLALFRRTIFPMAGVITRPWKPKPNAEVDKIVEVPLASFFDPALFGCFNVTYAAPFRPPDDYPRQRPCMIIPTPDGGEETLWGATLMIIVQFLSITMDYHLPEWRQGRTIERALRPDYLPGRPRP